MYSIKTWFAFSSKKLCVNLTYAMPWNFTWVDKVEDILFSKLFAIAPKQHGRSQYALESIRLISMQMANR